MDQHDPKDPGTFPWATWQNGSIWDATQGEDFTMEPLDFMVMLSRHAKTAELDLKVEEVKRSDGPHVIFQFLPKGLPRLSAIGIVYDHETDEISIDREGWTDDELVGLLIATLSQITGIPTDEFFVDEDSED